MVQKFLKDRQEARHFWRTFQSRAEEFQLADLNIERSLELQKRFGCLPRACYYNAAMMAMNMFTGVDYCEGIATCIIPTEHAWLVERDWNRVIDPTWIVGHQRARKPEHKIKDYYGVRIPLEIVREQLLQTEIASPILWKCMDQIKTVQRRKRLLTSK